MHYGEPTIRKCVPLAIGLVSTSNPQLPILDTLSKYSHDNDLQVALNAIFAMGLVDGITKVYAKAPGSIILASQSSAVRMDHIDIWSYPDPEYLVLSRCT